MIFLPEECNNIFNSLRLSEKWKYNKTIGFEGLRKSLWFSILKKSSGFKKELFPYGKTAHKSSEF